MKLLALLFVFSAAAARAIDVDFSTTRGEWRALHGVNCGPLTGGGTVDLTEGQRALRIPWVRLHDCHWPNPDVVDVSVVFPRADADPERAENYDFARTDAYLAGIAATGARIVYRLGESIEHEPLKRRVHPPADPARWARACAGIVEHYNEGWAGGARLGIPYWEIWNEPENRPAMWTGSDEQFLALYAATARTLRARFSTIKIGGPGIGAAGNFNAAGAFEPSVFLTRFLDFCRDESLPLDFLSWHCYTDDPAELAARARAIRALLDARGFGKTESHLNEWNFLPGKSWTPLTRRASGVERQSAYDTIAGPRGAAFIVAALLALNDAPVDVANFYRGDAGAWGLFSEQGAPNAAHAAMRAFVALLDTPRRVPVTDAERIAAAAGLDATGKRATILLANATEPARAITLHARNLPWSGPTRAVIRRIDATYVFENADTLTLDASAPDVPLIIEGPSVVLITLDPQTAPGAR